MGSSEQNRQLNLQRQDFPSLHSALSLQLTTSSLAGGDSSFGAGAGGAGAGAGSSSGAGAGGAGAGSSSVVVGMERSMDMES